MTPKKILSLLLTLLAVTCGASAAPPEAELRAFTLHAATSSVTTVDWDRDAVRQAAAVGDPVRVPDFVLTSGASVDLEIEPFSVTGPNTRFVLGRADGPDEPLDFDPSTISLFRGTVAGYAGSRVFLALSEGSSTGYIDLGPGRERYRVASKDEVGRELAPGALSVFRASPTPRSPAGLPPGVPLCGSDEEHAGLELLPVKGTVVPAPGLGHLELAVETDFEYFQLFGDATAAATYLVQLYAEVSAVYLRDVDVWVDLVFARIWEQDTDPFNGSDPLPEFRNYWNANMGSVARDVAQMFSGRRDYPFGGQASLSVLCSSTSGYSVVGYAMGFFPDPSKPSPFHYDITVTAHELGHQAGTGHTHSFPNNIDTCDDPLTTPQRGTIMSYCGQTFSGQNANRDLYFHSRAQQNIDNHVASSSCIVDDCNLNAVADSLDISGVTSADVNANGVPDECEDCNSNSVLDPDDIAGASADVNGNAIPDECEPDCNVNGLPDDWDISQGVSTDAYGNDIPDECEADCNSNAVSDYTEIQLDMSLDIDRDAVLDSCQDCDGDLVDDIAALGGGHGLWIGSGQTGSAIRRFYASTGVRDATSTGALVNEAQDLVFAPASGNVLVSSAGDNRVMEFDVSGTYLGDLVASGSGGLAHPTGLLPTPGGELLVGSHDTSSVLSYDAATGAFLGEFVAAGSGGLVNPFGLTFDRDGKLYVTSATDEVLRYDGATGAFLDVFVSAAANGGLSQPRGLTFKGDGNLLVASFGSDEVLEFDGATGAPLGKWAQVGTATVLTQTSPWGVRVAPSGNVFVSRTGEDFGSGGGGNHDHLRSKKPGLHLTDAVIYEFDVATGNFVRTHIGGADHQAVFPTGFDFIPGWGVDCNLSLLSDSCDITSGASLDVDLDGIPDECEVDCNTNGTLDRLDVIPYGTSFDCNSNLLPDECDISSGTSNDVDLNGVPDECQCGDGVCEAGEDCTSCPADCPSFAVGASCGNGLCEAGDGEDCVTCAQDCNGQQSGKPSGRFCCGFGGENPLGCGDAACTTGGFSCTETPQGGGGNTCCGDFTCESPEDGFSCAVDCGPPPVCGDAICDPGEDQCSCASDCGAPPASEVGLCTDGADNDCDLAVDCADTDCDGVDPACQAVDCSTFGDKSSCNAEPTCRWDNKNKVCVPN